jgi:6-phosphogluconolactonase (cycloisomerase 2 family)
MQREMTEEEQSYMESQQKLFTLYKHRNMNVATAQALEKERKISQLTLIEMKNIPQDNVCYKSIGRM